MSILGRKLLFTVFLFAFSSAAFGQDFVKFGLSHDTDFWGNSSYYSPPFPASFPSALEYIAPNGRNQITSLTLNNTNVTDVFNGNYGAFDALVVSENINAISPASYTLFGDYVNNGGCLILTGDHGNSGTEEDFLNSAFGYSMSGSIRANEGVDTFALQVAAAVGTAFAGGPASLLAENGTALFFNTPGSTIYDGATGVAVFTVAQGLGTVVAIAYDYCCEDSSATTQQVILDWFEVVDRAFAQCGFGGGSQPIPASSPFSLIVATILLVLFGVVAIRRRTLRMQI